MYDGELLLRGLPNLPEALLKMGYPSLRPGQDAVVWQVMAGRDTICILPTSTGKTACFVIPTLCHGWKTLVFSPLVALMRDQVRGLWRIGIAAAQINSGQSAAENAGALREWAAGRLDMLYVAPERLQNAEFLRVVEARKPDMVVLDEAHTLAQWSDNFRPAYTLVGDFVEKVQPRVVSCFTATCAAEAERQIRKVVGIPDAKLLLYYPRRTNLQLESSDYHGAAGVARLIREIPGSVLVYCATIKHVEQLAADLDDIISDRGVTLYHGKLPDATKKANQDAFMTGEVDIVVATNAFGMGIDKPDIRGVIHRDMPGSIESLAQEVGRAGRDGEPSRCVALYDEKSIKTQRFFVDVGNPSENDIRRFYETLRTLSDASGELRVVQKEIAKLAGVHEKYTAAIMRTLLGNGVVVTEKSPDKLVQLRLTDSGAAAVAEDAGSKLAMVSGLIAEGGVAILNSYFEVDRDWLAARWGVSDITVNKWLRKWDSEGLLDYVPPFRGAVIRLTGDVECVDFTRVSEKAMADHRKLEEVVRYFDCPNEEKHAYIEASFDVGEGHGR